MQKEFNRVKALDIIQPADKVLISFSAGPDSVFLLEVLRQFLPSQQLVMVYFDHNLRPKEVEQEKITVQMYAKKTNIKAIIKQIPVQRLSKKNKISIETAGRILRKKILLHYAKLNNCTCIATGHHKDDIIETFFLRLFRGVRSQFNILPPEEIRASHLRLIRPLVDFTKNEILDYLDKNKISYKIDSSNQQNLFKRNLIRNQLIPICEKIEPGYIKTIDKFLKYQVTLNQFLDTLCEPVISDFEKTENRIKISIHSINKHPLFLQKRILYMALVDWQHKNDTSYQFSESQINEIIDQFYVKRKKKHSRIDLSKTLECIIDQTYITIQTK